MKRRTNITINAEIYDKALEVMATDHFDDFSGFVEQLVREEWKRRNGPVVIRDQPPSPEQLAAAEIAAAAAAAAGKPAGIAPVSYAHTRKAKPRSK